MASESAEAACRRILVVEDSLLVAEVLCEMVTERGYCVVGPCARLSTALRLAADTAIDGALLDINLAGEYRFPLADHLWNKGVPFAFLTGYVEGTVIPIAFRDVPVLSKPFIPADIDGVMRRYFGPRSGSADSRKA